MTERELDRLVTKTSMSPICRQTLRYVRTAVIEGNAGEPEVGRTSWSIAVTRRNGLTLTFEFPLKES